MTLRETREMALALMAQHGLTAKGWTFTFDRARCRLGCADFAKREIRLSAPLTLLNPDKVRDTILHEIAHALVGLKAGHNYLWQHVARQIGATPERCYGDAAQPKSRYVFICKHCGKSIPVYRITKKIRAIIQANEEPKSYHIACGRTLGRLTLTRSV